MPLPSPRTRPTPHRRGPRRRAVPTGGPRRDVALLGLWAALLPACARPTCPEGQALVGEACVDVDTQAPGPGAGEHPLLPGQAWQIQYTGTLDVTPGLDLWDLDLFDISDGAIATVHEDALLACYFSAGSYEDWRPDAADFPAEALGRALDGWPGEWWLDIRRDDVRALMAARLDLAAARGCDLVDPDNVNGYTNHTGFPLTAADQLAFNRFLADEAHTRGLGVLLKNDVEQLDLLEPWFDGAVNEECLDYDECGLYDGLLAADKAVLHLEYVDDWADAEARADEVCGAAPGLDTLVKTWELGAERIACAERE